MKIRFTKGICFIGREPKPKEQPLTPTQAARVQSLVSSMAPKPKPAAATKPKPSSKGRTLTPKELNGVLDDLIRELSYAVSPGRQGTRALVR